MKKFKFEGLKSKNHYMIITSKSNFAEQEIEKLYIDE